MNNYIVRAEVLDYVDGTVLSIRITVSASNIGEAVTEAQVIINRSLHTTVRDSLTMKAVETHS